MSAELLKKMKFVQGSVAKKDLLPALTHFRIEKGRIQGYNGRIALSVPIDFDVDCTPKAVPLVSAISKCKETIQLGMTATGRLSVKSGKFRTYIDCIEGPTAHVEPEGEIVNIDGSAMLNALSLLQPFIGDDAARPWCNGVLFSGRSAYATNNVVIAEHWLGEPFPIEVVIPRETVKELLRLKETPERFQVAGNSMTFHYADGKWARTNLIDHEWPSQIKTMFDVPANPEKIPDEFYEGLDAMKPFLDKFNRIVFEPGLMRTHMAGTDEGSSYELTWLKNKSTFPLSMLEKLNGTATSIDLSMYPKPCAWFGDNIRGLIIGMHWLEGQL